MKVTDAFGNIQGDLDYSYDAWGRRRVANTWTYDGSTTPLIAVSGVDANGDPWISTGGYDPGSNIAPPNSTPQSPVGTAWFNRGYRGHEHMDDFQLIHMNARLYNPFLGTFLSPDRVIADPTNSQNYNRYSYGLGNPTKYTDPSGYSPMMSGRSSFLFQSAFFGSIDSQGGLGNINNTSIGGDLGNQFNSIEDPTKPWSLTNTDGYYWTLGGDAAELVAPPLPPKSEKAEKADINLFFQYNNYNFNGTEESPYKTLDEYNAVEGTNFTDYSLAMLYHDQKYYRDPALKEMKQRIYSATSSAANTIFTTASLVVGPELIVFKGISLVYRLTKGVRLVRIARVGVKTKLHRLKLTAKTITGPNKGLLNNFNSFVTNTVAKTGAPSTPSGNFYSVAFEMKLKPTSYPGVSRYMHFKEANIALDGAMKTNPMLGNLGIKVPRFPTGTIKGKSPTNWVWHHHVDEGVMQLVPKSQHPNVPGGIFWETMHPGGSGGYSIWGK